MKITKISTRVATLLAVLFACLLHADLAFAEKPSVRPVGQVVVVDSKGKIVGNTDGGMIGDYFSGRATILLKVDERLFAVRVVKNTLFGFPLYFRFTNCQGQPWYPVASADQPLWPTAAIFTPGMSVYLPRLDAVVEQITYQSVWQWDGGCRNLSNTTALIPAEPLIDLDTVFTPPFSVRTIP